MCRIAFEYNTKKKEDAEDIWRAKKVRKAIKEGKVKLIPAKNVYRKLGL